jgi:hypothetical protein
MGTTPAQRIIVKLYLVFFTLAVFLFNSALVAQQQDFPTGFVIEMAQRPSDYDGNDEFTYRPRHDSRLYSRPQVQTGIAPELDVRPSNPMSVSSIMIVLARC